MRAYALQMMCRTHLFSKRGRHGEVLSPGCCGLWGAELVSSAFNEFTGVCSDTMGSSVGLDTVEFGTMGADMMEGKSVDSFGVECST